MMNLILEMMSLNYLCREPTDSETTNSEDHRSGPVGDQYLVEAESMAAFKFIKE